MIDFAGYRIIEGNQLPTHQT